MIKVCKVLQYGGFGSAAISAIVLMATLGPTEVLGGVAGAGLMGLIAAWALGKS